MSAKHGKHFLTERAFRNYTPPPVHDSGLKPLQVAGELTDNLLKMIDVPSLIIGIVAGLSMSLFIIIGVIASFTDEMKKQNLHCTDSKGDNDKETCDIKEKDAEHVYHVSVSGTVRIRKEKQV